MASSQGFPPARAIEPSGQRWSGRPLGAARLIAIILAIVVAGPCLAQDVTFAMKNVGDRAATKFKKQFFERKETLEQYLAATNFTLVFRGNFDVEVSNGKPFSEALLFVWDGRRGHMYFPASRARDGNAAILHELAHVYAPNQVRFLAEGYPAYLEEKMGNIEAFPTRGLSIECGMNEYKSALRLVDLASFDGVPTAREVFLGDDIGLEKAFAKLEDAAGNRHMYAYLVSASFVKFLIETYGLDKFKALYEQTPLTPKRATKADPGRYRHVFFGKSIAELQSDWLHWLKDKQRSCSG